MTRIFPAWMSFVAKFRIAWTTLRGSRVFVNFVHGCGSPLYSTPRQFLKTTFSKSAAISEPFLELGTPCRLMIFVNVRREIVRMAYAVPRCALLIPSLASDTKLCAGMRVIIQRKGSMRMTWTYDLDELKDAA